MEISRSQEEYKTRMWMESPCFAYVFVFAFFSAFVFVIVLPLVIACHRLSAYMEISVSLKTRMWMESPCCEEMRDFLMTRGASTDFYRHPPTSNVIHDKLPTYGFVPLREPLHCSRNCPKFEAGPLCEIESWRLKICPNGKGHPMGTKLGDRFPRWSVELIFRINQWDFSGPVLREGVNKPWICFDPI